jgi:hypothetical protein
MLKRQGILCGTNEPPNDPPNDPHKNVFGIRRTRGKEKKESENYGSGAQHHERLATRDGLTYTPQARKGYG